MCTASLTASLAIYTLSNTLRVHSQSHTNFSPAKAHCWLWIFCSRVCLSDPVSCCSAALSYRTFLNAVWQDARTEASQSLAINSWPVCAVQTSFRLTAAFSTAPWLRQLVAGDSWGSGSFLGRSMWDLWWTKCNWEKFFCDCFGFPPPVLLHYARYSFYWSRYSLSRPAGQACKRTKKATCFSQ